MKILRRYYSTVKGVLKVYYRYSTVQGTYDTRPVPNLKKRWKKSLTYIRTYIHTHSHTHTRHTVNILYLQCIITSILCTGTIMYCTLLVLVQLFSTILYGIVTYVHFIQDQINTRGHFLTMTGSWVRKACCLNYGKQSTAL